MSRAATITETVPFTIQSSVAANFPPQTLNVVTPQFDPALGVFDSGVTTISGTITIGLEFFTTGAGGPYDILLSDTLTVGGIPGLFVEELTGVLPANQPAFIVQAPAFVFGPVERSDPAVLVVGAGTWNQLFSLPFPGLTIKQGPAAVLPAVVITGSSVTNYTYTPAMTPVPEPPSSSLFAMLLGCLWVTIRRLRTNRLGYDRMEKRYI